MPLKDVGAHSEQLEINENSCDGEKTRRYYRRMNRIVNYLNGKYSELDPGEKADIASNCDITSYPFYYDKDNIYNSDSESVTASPRNQEDDNDFKFNCPYSDNSFNNLYK